MIEQPNNENRPDNSRSRQVIFILIVYLLLVFSSKFGRQAATDGKQRLISNLKAGDTQKIDLTFMFGIFSLSTPYTGNCQNKNQSRINFKQSGRANIYFVTINQNQIAFGLQLYNGEYSDDGYLFTGFTLNSDKDLKIQKTGKTAIMNLINPNKSSTYKIQQIFNTLEIGSNQVQAIQFNFSLSQDNNLQVSAIITTQKYDVKMNIVGQENAMFRTIFFAVIMFIISYFQFNSVLTIIRQVIQGSQNPTRYSLLTVLIATMWDSVLCLLCFIQAFQNQQNLVLFILPAFLLCVLFTNLQLRWMLSIFQNNNNQLDIRSIICRFNIISYGSFLLIYPILLFTNLNIWFFIVLSCLIFPQIYVNALSGTRPNLNSPFYSKFLMFRFLIIFYLKGFPLNIFHLKPDYILCVVCLFIIMSQYFLLWIQKIYGPKKVLPAFMLPPVFNYKFTGQFNVEEGQISQCAICLTSLSVQPIQQVLNQESVQYKLMQTPCKHYYHSLCLIQWMKIKMECPQCRAKLPPYQ